jgi:putative salt-induced outer membrane protein
MKKIIMILSLLLPAGAMALEEGLRNQADVGIILTTGNASSATYNIAARSNYQFPTPQLLSLDVRYLQSFANNVESMRYWIAALRFDQFLSERFSIFLSQNMESNVFAGFAQRYNSDVGVRYVFVKDDDFSWLGEAGYRYALTNQVPLGNQVSAQMARLFTELNKSWDKSLSTKLWFEGTPNFTNTNGYRLMGEASVSVALSNTFSVKTAYLVKYDNLPPPGIGQNTDSFFTTSLVARF